MRIKWTDELEELIRRLYPTTNTEEIAAMIPGATAAKVRYKANELGVKKTPEARRRYLKRNRRKAVVANRGSTPWNKKKPVRLTCETCQEPFRVKPYRAETARFCSRQCANEWKRSITGEDHWLYTQVERTCEWCGATFTAKPAKVEIGEALFCSRQCLGARNTQLQGGRRSSLEHAVEEVLDGLGIGYEVQRRIGKWTVDFLLPDPGVVIECDGVYWHGLPEVKRRDRRKDKALRKHGYTVVRIGGEQIRRDAFRAVVSALRG